MIKSYALKSILVFLITLCALTVPPLVEATIVIRMNILEMTLQSKRIVEGTVRSIDSKVFPNGMVVSTVTIDVRETLKGKNESVITFRIPGGPRPDGTSVAISGSPSFKSGDRVIVFLEGKNGDIVSGMSQGKFLIETDGQNSFATQNTRGLCLLDAKPSTVSESGGPVTDWAFSTPATKAIAQMKPGTDQNTDSRPDGHFIQGGVLKVPLKTFKDTVRDCIFGSDTWQPNTR